MACVKTRKFILKTGERGIVRSALEHDAKGVLELTRANLREGTGMVSTPAEFKLTLTEERRFIRDHLKHPTWIALVAEVEGKIVGFLNFKTNQRIRLAHSGDFGVGVQQPWRGRGIGRSLLTALVGWAKRNPRVEKVSLAVFVNNAPAISLYKKLGFAVEGRRVRGIKLAPRRYLDEFMMFRWVK